jgi:hypothetical protein
VSSARPSARTNAWAAIGAGVGATVCYPVNGSEVEKAVVNSTCTFIVLLRDGSQPYTIQHTLNVTRTIIITGANLLFPPALNGTVTPRLFRSRPHWVVPTFHTALLWMSRPTRPS